jgi:hypothetical protein
LDTSFGLLNLKVDFMGNNITMENESFTYSFKTSKTPGDIFSLLLDIEQWWSGLHGEIIKGASDKVGDEFTFEAGRGAHYSKQELVELVPGKRIVWRVKDSKLTFLNDTKEWTDTSIRFDISTDKNMTILTFTHEGLVPQVECYNACSGEWPKYLDKLKQKLI